MKKLLVAVALLAFTGAAQAQQKPTAAPAPAPAAAVKANPNAPQFNFKGGDTHDFGAIPEGPDASYAFEFKNTGKEPLIIQNASASCGCTTPEWPKEPILPGKSGKIVVTFHTAGKAGQPFNKTVFITSNAPAQAGKDRYEIYIKGNVTPGAAGAGADMKDKEMKMKDDKVKIEKK